MIPGMPFSLRCRQKRKGEGSIQRYLTIVVDPAGVLVLLFELGQPSQGSPAKAGGSSFAGTSECREDLSMWDLPYEVVMGLAGCAARDSPSDDFEAKTTQGPAVTVSYAVSVVSGVGLVVVFNAVVVVRERVVVVGSVVVCRKIRVRVTVEVAVA